MQASKAFLSAWLLLIAALIGCVVYLYVQSSSTSPPPAKSDPAVVPLDPKKTPKPAPQRPTQVRPRARPAPVPTPPRQTLLEGVVHGPGGEPVAGARVAIFPPARAVHGGPGGGADAPADMDELKKLSQLFYIEPESWDQPRPLTRWTGGPDEADQGAESALAAVETKDDGTFAIPLRPGMATPLRLTAVKEGVGAAGMSSVIPDGRKLDLVLGPGASFKGVVLTEVESSPVADAVVKLDNGARRFSAATEASGKFTVDGVTPGFYRLVVFAKGRTPLFLEKFKIEAADPNPVTLRMPRGTRLVVKCAVDQGARVVANADVFAYCEEIFAYVRGKSDAQGLVEFQGLPAGKWEVNATAAGVVPVSSVIVSIDKNQVSQDDTLDFETAVETPIQVVDEDGRPLAGVQFYTVNADMKYDAVRSVKVGATDSDGKLAFPFEQDGARAQLYGFKPGYTLVHAEPDIAPGPGEAPTPLRLVAKKPIRVHGVVRTSDGKAVPDAIVSINLMPSDTNDPATLDLEIRADADGRYDFPYLPRIDGISVAASTPDGAAEDDQDVEMKDGKADYVVDFALELDEEMPVEKPAPVKPGEIKK